MSDVNFRRNVMMYGVNLPEDKPQFERLFPEEYGSTTPMPKVKPPKEESVGMTLEGITEAKELLKKAIDENKDVKELYILKLVNYFLTSGIKLPYETNTNNISWCRDRAEEILQDLFK